MLGLKFNHVSKRGPGDISSLKQFARNNQGFAPYQINILHDIARTKEVQKYDFLHSHLRALVSVPLSSGTRKRCVRRGTWGHCHMPEWAWRPRRWRGPRCRCRRTSWEGDCPPGSLPERREGDSERKNGEELQSQPATKASQSIKIYRQIISIFMNTGAERELGWLPWSSLGTLRQASITNDDQGSHHNDLVVSVSEIVV